MQVWIRIGSFYGTFDEGHTKVIGNPDLTISWDNFHVKYPCLHFSPNTVESLNCVCAGKRTPNNPWSFHNKITQSNHSKHSVYLVGTNYLKFPLAWEVVSSGEWIKNSNLRSMRPSHKGYCRGAVFDTVSIYEPIILTKFSSRLYFSTNR